MTIILPPDITSFGERGGLDDLWRHPRVGASRGHACCLVHLTRQPKVGDLERFEL